MRSYTNKQWEILRRALNLVDQLMVLAYMAEENDLPNLARAIGWGESYVARAARISIHQQKDVAPQPMPTHDPLLQIARAELIAKPGLTARSLYDGMKALFEDRCEAWWAIMTLSEGGPPLQCGTEPEEFMEKLWRRNSRDSAKGGA